MKVLNVHNRHVGAGGTEMMFGAITSLLRRHGHEVIEVHRDNADLKSLWQKIGAFGSAIYSPGAYREFDRMLRAERPDVVHVHNLFPQLSVSVLDACREHGVPVVLHVHDYKITCPTAQHLREGKLCSKCVGGREYWCALHNCRGSVPMSISYALRNTFARASGKIHDGVTHYLCVSEFVRRLLITAGYPAERTSALNNFFDLPPFAGRNADGDYVAYVGRISPEKGIDVLVEAARTTGLPVQIAGDPAFMPGICDRAPANVRFVGKLNREQLDRFLSGARMLVVPSVWWEAFGLVAAEAMSRELPVIATQMGGLPEVVLHGDTGLLIPPNDPSSLAEAMRELWQDAPRRRAMGVAGRVRAERLYSAEAFYAGLMRTYRGVLARETGPAAAPQAVDLGEMEDAVRSRKLSLASAG